MNGHDYSARNSSKSKQEACGGPEFVDNSRSSETEKPVNSRKEEETNEDLPGKHAATTLINRGPNILENNSRSGDVQEIDFNIVKNGGECKTDMYEEMEKHSRLVVRRGKEITLKLKVSGSVNGLILSVELDMPPQHQPKPSMGTKATFSVGELLADRWSAKEDPTKEPGWKNIKVQIPVDAPIGKWRLSAGSYKAPRKFVVLFNPYNRDDPVYFEDETQLKNEYILRDDGFLYGDQNKHWLYNQFDEGILDVLWRLLDRAEEKNGFHPLMKADPVKVTRTLTTMLNDYSTGLLFGKWKGEYSNGKHPTFWNGSGQIFRQFISNGYNIVKYGQCWVFAGVLTTSCRALGIPCRSVCCYGAAHETNPMDLRLNLYYKDMSDYDAKDNVDHTIRTKSFHCKGDGAPWNYHYWNEVWMARRDLGSEYDGWQVVDSTPQERSGAKGVYQCGPASKKAIRNCKPGFAYDVSFVAAEVNADVFKFLCTNPTAEKKEDAGIVYKDESTSSVGTEIVTNVVGGNEKEDLIPTYKPPQEEEEEWKEKYRHNNSVTRRIVDVTEPRQQEKTKLTELGFTVLPVSDVVYGCPITVGLKIQSKVQDPRAVFSTVQVFLEDYTARVQEVIKIGTKKIQVPPHKSGMITGTINPSDYVGKFCSTMLFRVEFIVKVSNSQNNVWADSVTFSPRKPKLEMKVLPLDEAVVESAAHVILEFTNPLSIPLTKCEYAIEGPGICKPSHNEHGDIPPGGRFQIDHPVTPWKSGQRLIVAKFVSEELKGVHGSVKVVVREEASKNCQDNDGGKDAEEC